MYQNRGGRGARSQLIMILRVAGAFGVCEGAGGGGDKARQLNFFSLVIIKYKPKTCHALFGFFHLSSFCILIKNAFEGRRRRRHRPQSVRACGAMH